MNTSIITNFQKKEQITNSSDPETDIWLKMEQEEIPDNYDEVSTVDVSGMMSKVLKGESAKAYIAERCPYVIITGSTVTVRINFYVYTSDINLYYELETGFGSIGPGMLNQQRRTFDVIFEGSKSEFLELNVTYGQLTPKMPVYDPLGQKIPIFVKDRNYKLVNGYAVADRNIYCVFSFDGVVRGHEHTLTMEFKKTDLESGILSISNFKNSVIASWYNEASEIETETLDIELPGCVESLLSTCDDGKIVGDRLGTLNAPKQLLVYSNDCNGKVIGTKWVNKNEY